MTASGGQPRRPLLFHLTAAADRQRPAVGPALAAAAARAGWAYEGYTDDVRRGRHFGGGVPADHPPGWANGALVAGGGHVEQVLWLAASFDVVAVGDPAALLWPVLRAAGAEELLASDRPAELYAAVFGRLGLPVPEEALVLDGSPQGPHGVVTAPYLYPEFLDGPPRLGIEVSAGSDDVKDLQRIGVGRLCGRWLDPARARAFEGRLDEAEGEVGDRDYAEVTRRLAEAHRGWARGFLLGDPGLVSTQLARAQQRRLLPLYSRPHTTVIEAAAGLLREVGGTVFGRQYDDRDFFALAPLGHGLQLVDPGPPFEALRGRARAVSRSLPAERGNDLEDNVEDDVDDAQLEAWADEGRILTTLLFWSGMIRELDCLPRIVDLAATTGLRAGLVLTAEAVLQQPRPPLSLLGVPPERGGVRGLLELTLGSAGSMVAVEGLLPPQAFAGSLAAARASLRDVLPDSRLPRGWWPILDAPLVPAGRGPIRIENGRPLIRVPQVAPRAAGGPAAAGGTGAGLRARVGRVVSRAGVDRYLEGARPYDWQRPGPFRESIGAAVRDAGFDYMWTKTHFGEPRVVHRSGAFTALPLTAGVWGGWTPFYTAERPGDLARAEGRLARRDSGGWLVATVDSPLWLGSGEIHEHGAKTYALATWMAEGGRSGRLVNALPRVVARYARLLDDRARQS